MIQYFNNFIPILVFSLKLTEHLIILCNNILENVKFLKNTININMFILITKKMT